ncbi:MAG TPA: MBL fold metallo-hydrolase [Terrimicrobiaceae bacterium]|nr:MBL fold metallo-hydrolase [Terrimicrobiaceae bacterium]
MVRRLLRTGKRAKPQNHVDMRLGEGWHKRNFLAEVVIPSLFTKRHGHRVKPIFPELDSGKICVTWIGHASFLIQTPEHSVLIDPNWAKWLKVIKRIKHPGIELRDLPAIDLVLVTHAHFDHLDRRTLRAIASDQPIAVPEHVGNLVHDLGFNKIHELRHWQSFEHGDLKVTLTPARHWGARILHDSHRGFGGFLIEYAGRTIFHCGDTAYFDGFREIGRRAKIELALLPIGAYEAPTKRDVHMTPEQALQAFRELRAKTMIPMHFGTFRLSYEPLHEPPRRLLEKALELQLLDKIRLLNEGEPTVF